MYNGKIDVVSFLIESWPFVFKFEVMVKFIIINIKGKISVDRHIKINHILDKQPNSIEI
jgi:hypothetical protein